MKSDQIENGYGGLTCIKLFYCLPIGNISFIYILFVIIYIIYVVRRRGHLTPRQPLSVCALLPAPREEQASTASWEPRPPFEAAEMG